MHVGEFSILYKGQEYNYREGGRVSYYTIVLWYRGHDLYNDIHNREH
jgi:hypothetical protein